MSTLQFDKREGFSLVESLTMIKGSANNNVAPVATKVGYEFLGWWIDIQSGGHVDAKYTTVYESDGSIWIANQKVVTVYESDGSSWIAEEVDASDSPIVITPTMVFNADGKAVKSDGFWSDDYPNGVYMNNSDAILYAKWEGAAFHQLYYTKDNDECFLYQKINNEWVKVEVYNGS